MIDPIQIGTKERPILMQVIHSEDTDVQSPPTNESCDTAWVQIKDTILSIEDRQLIRHKQQPTDKYINAALRLIHEQFPEINGLILTLFRTDLYVNQQLIP